ncbi:hypothetical protein KBC75_04100 [Candidatus Shapirobacteria bacterium]|nr:hypothetical protein [Candidatus Shapirobacteria bacterium]
MNKMSQISKLVVGLVFLVMVFLNSGSKVLAQGTGLPTFAFGDDKKVSEQIEGDLIMAGGKVEVTSNINGDAYVAGGKVNFDGSVEEDLVVAGGEVVIKGVVGKNLTVAGGKVTIDENSIVGGYVLAAGGEVIMLGQFAGSVKVVARDLKVGEKVHIQGDLEADIESGQVAETAIVDGEKKVVVHEAKQTQIPENVNKALVTSGKVIFWLGQLVTLLVLLAIGGKAVEKVEVNQKNFWATLGWGLVVLIVTPVLALILLVSMVGSPLGLMLFPIYFASLYLSGLVVAITMGAMIAKNGWLKMKNRYLLAIIGLILVTVVSQIPIIGGWVKFVVLILGLGTMFRAVRGKK